MEPIRMLYIMTYSEFEPPILAFLSEDEAVTAQDTFDLTPVGSIWGMERILNYREEVKQAAFRPAK